PQSDNASPDRVKQLVGTHFQKECQRQALGAGKNTPSATAVQTAQRDFQSALKSARLAEIEYVRLQGSPSEELGREFDELLKLANVTDVSVTNDTIVVKTNTLYCVHPKTGSKHEIGEFEIHISMSSNLVKWYNQTRKVHGGGANMNAPHVDANGNACY